MTFNFLPGLVIAGKSSRSALHLLAGLAVVTALAACSTASMKDEVLRIPESYALPPAAKGVLAEISNRIIAEHGTEYSGFHILDSSQEGLDWRLALIDSAVSSLDIQTYLWYPDYTGVLLFERAILAAQRGVKVRLIVDDLLLQGFDQFIANINAHPNIDFRIFNPWSDRAHLGERAGEMIAEMERLNTRMHDKLLIADGHAAIVGGRNNGDHYFGLSEAYNFHDTDLLGIGHFGVQANDMFDRFWNSEWVVSSANLNTEPDKEIAADQWRRIQERSANAPELASYSRQVQSWRDAFDTLLPELRMGRSKIVFDEAHPEQIDRSMASSMFNFFNLAQSDLMIMNAYVIPGESSISFMEELRDRGVKVTILTNSLASHDVPAVNSHYEPWRDDFIRVGVALYELRQDPAISALVDVPPIQGQFTGLHSKTAVVDRRYTFIGSMNLDPRSANINTEMGAFVDSPALAEDMIRIIERDMLPENSWRVLLDEDGGLYWVNNEETVTQQPARDGMQRVMNVLLKIVPKEQN
jgi:putative cardiolipin synthase